MAFFAEQMEKLTNEILTTRRERAAFVVDVEQKSHQILGEAKKFMQVIGQEQKVNAERLQKDLAANDEQRVRTSKAQRQQERTEIKSARKQVLDMLSQNCRQRKQDVAVFRKDVAADLHQAANVWRKVFQAAATNGAVKGKVKVTAAATVTPAAKPEAPTKPHEQPKQTGYVGHQSKAHETHNPQTHGNAGGEKSTHEANHGKGKDSSHPH